MDDTSFDDQTDAQQSLTATQRETIRSATAKLHLLAKEFAGALSNIDADTIGVDEFLDVRAQVGVLFVSINECSAEITKQFGVKSAQARMTRYMLPRLGEEVPAAELGGVSCIWEWARRTRELDVEHGWEIRVGSKDGISEGTYMLLADDRNDDRARLWRQKNQIRKLRGSGEKRILELLKARYPQPVHIDDLDYVAKIRSRGRRKRNLQEAGWRIASSETDPLLPHGWYRLESLEIGPPRAREYLKLREELLREAVFTCQRCGYRPNKVDSRPLQVHHVQFLRDGGNDDKGNLLVVCRPCHAGIHSLDQTSVDDELLNPGADPLIDTTECD